MRFRNLAGGVSAALLLSAGAVLALSTSAPATTPRHEEKICGGTWKMRGATGAYPAVVFGSAPAGSSFGKDRARLVKPAAGVQPGVEFAAKDLDFENETGSALTVRVRFSLFGGASHTAGAVRMFGYAEEGADTAHDAPTYGPAIAGSNLGWLSFTLPAGAKLGTLGLVYDASNDKQGVVRFSDLKIGRRLVQFTPCPTPTPSTSSPSPTPTATTPTTPATTAPTTQPTQPEPTTTTTPPVIIGRAGGLPVTGSSVPVGLIIAVGAGALIAGAAILGVTRRRRAKFSAE